MKKLLAILLTASVFTACANNDNDDNATDSSNMMDNSMQQPMDSSTMMNDSSNRMMDTSHMNMRADSSKM